MRLGIHVGLGPRSTPAEEEPGETLGPELVTNGSFETDTDWTLSPGAYIDTHSHYLMLDDSGEGAGEQSGSQAVALTPGATYRLTLVLTSAGGSGPVRASVGGTLGTVRSFAGGAGPYVEDLVAGADGILHLRMIEAGLSAGVDLVSLMEVL